MDHVRREGKVINIKYQKHLQETKKAWLVDLHELALLWQIIVFNAGAFFRTSIQSLTHTYI
jgi:hypothetical protein